MSILRAARTLLTLFTVSALLFCYSAGSVLALQTVQNGEEIVGNVAACHALDQGGAPHDAPRGACDIAQYVSDSNKLPITPALAATEPGFFLYRPLTSTTAPDRRGPTVTAAAFPPLRLLHCRLLN